MALAVITYLSVMTVLGALFTVGSVGKPRGPVTPGVAAGTSFIAMVHLAAFAYLSTRV